MPGSLSKSFYAAIANKNCADILHPGLTCRESMKGSIVDAAMGSLKFYLPICVVPLLFKNLKRKTTWKEFAVSFGKCFAFGFFLNLCSFSGICCS